MKQKFSTTIGTVLLLTVFVSLFPHALSAQSFPGKARDNATVDFQTYLESSGVTGDKALDAASRFQTAYDNTSGNIGQSARNALQGAGLDPNLANGYLGTASQIQTAQQQIDNRRSPGGSSGCGWSRDSWSLCLAWVFHALLVQTTGLFTYVAGQIFNVAVGFGLDSKSFNVDIVEKGWVIIRDIANMSFIFVLIYIAVKTILNMAGSDTKGLIAKVIVVALLINFSLFFAKFVIDVGNILAIQFYDKISVGGGATTDISKGGKTFAPTQVKDISGVVASGINAQKLLQNAQFQEFFKKSDTSFFENLGVFFLLMLAFAVVNIMLAFVFIAAAFQFIARVLGLWVVMIMAPAAFVAYIIPGWSKWSERWWSELIRLTFYAPVFMFVFYIALLFITGGQQSGGGLLANVSQQIQAIRAAGTTFGTTANIIAVVFMNAAIVVGLLFAALKVASRMSTTLSSTIGGFIGKIGYGAGGFAARNTFGRLAYGLADSRLFKDNAVGRFLNRRALQPLASGSFDMRGAPLGLGKELGAGAAGGKGGYEKQLKTAKEADEAFGKKLRPSAVEAETLDKRAKTEALANIIKKQQKAQEDELGAIEKGRAAAEEYATAQGEANTANRRLQDFTSQLGISERTITALNQQIGRERSAGRDTSSLESRRGAEEERRKTLVEERAERQNALAAARDRMRRAQGEQEAAQRVASGHRGNIVDLAQAHRDGREGRANKTFDTFFKEADARVGVSARTESRQKAFAKSLESWISPSFPVKLAHKVAGGALALASGGELEGLFTDAGNARAAAYRKEIKATPEKKLLDEIEKRLKGGGGGEKKEEEKR